MNAADDNCKAHRTSGHAHALLNSAQVAGRSWNLLSLFFIDLCLFYWYIHLIRILILHVVELSLNVTTVAQLLLVGFFLW